MRIILILLTQLLTLFGFGIRSLHAETTVSYKDVQAAYLSLSYLGSQKKVQYILDLLDTTSLNAVVIDFKDSNNALDPKHLERERAIVEQFHALGAYVIARIVTLQDTWYASKHPDVALKNSDGSFWYSGRKVWKRYWLDPAAPEVLSYTIRVAHAAIDAGFDEVQFDYIRFPSDGNMKTLRFPVYRESIGKVATMTSFFNGLHDALKAKKPSIITSVDIFGEVTTMSAGTVGIGQDLFAVANAFDVISPMAYPSHYGCGAFGVHDPTAHPKLVYERTMAGAQKRLSEVGVHTVVRPWIQDFSLRNIYGCGGKISYGPEQIRDQIEGSEIGGGKGFMLWNAGSKFTGAAFK